MLSKVKRQSGLPWPADSEKTSELKGRLYQGLSFKPCVEQEGYGENDEEHTIFLQWEKKQHTAWTSVLFSFPLFYICPIFYLFTYMFIWKSKLNLFFFLT